MSNYNSTNTYVLATHEQAGGNTRMLLLHICENGRHEYVIGSYFQQMWYDGALGYEHLDYSWDWGHYFTSVTSAVAYWNSEVVGEPSIVKFDDHGWGKCSKCESDVYDDDKFCSQCGAEIVKA